MSLLSQACGCGWSRRGVLTGMMAAGLGAAAAPTPGQRIDVHYHVLPPQFLKEAPASANSYRTNPRINGWTVERALAEMDQNGVAKSILSFPQPSQWSLAVEDQRRLARLCNDYFAGVVQGHPTRFGLFAGLPPLTDVDGCVAEIDYAYGSLKAHGLRLMSSYQDKWLGDKSFAPVMDALNARHAVVFVHPDTAVCCRNLQPGIHQGYLEYTFDTARAATSLWFNDAFDRWPNIRFILSHGGGALPMVADRIGITGRPDPKGGSAPLHDAMTQLKRLYVDTANAASAPSLAAALALFGPSHILWGTDEPFIATPRQIELLDAAGLAPGIKRGIERDNALALIPGLA